MRKILLVSWREFKHTALTKAFILGAVFTPLAIMAVVVVLPNLMKTNLPPLTGTLAIVDSTGEVAPLIRNELTPERIAERLSPAALGEQSMQRTARRLRQLTPGQMPPRIQVDVESFDSSADIESLKNRVRDKELLGLAIIPSTVIDAPASRRENRFEMFIASDASPFHTAMFEDAISESIVRRRVERTGVDLEAARRLVSDPSADTFQLGKTGGQTGESAELKMIIPAVFMMLLWITTFTSGNYLLTSTIEEKSNKVMEVLLSAVSPFELMAGKILGQAGVSFIMLAMYSGVGIAVLVATAYMHLISPMLLVYLFVFFIMAYFMVAAIMAGVGSAVSELRDAQSLITPAMLVLMVPLLLWLPISNDPNGLLATVSSYIPPLTPFVMILRVTTATEPVPTWQIISSIIAGFCWTIIMVWACAKVFRVGVLMYGKPPTPLELLRWVRYR